MSDPQKATRVSAEILYQLQYTLQRKADLLAELEKVEIQHQFVIHSAYSYYGLNRGDSLTPNGEIIREVEPEPEPEPEMPTPMADVEPFYEQTTYEIEAPQMEMEMLPISADSSFPTMDEVPMFRSPSLYPLVEVID